MPIQVVCPGCHTRFSVSEKFAGQTGPCPKCKAKIRVPDKSEEVKVHAPEEFAGGGRSATGELVTKPIARTDVEFNPVAAVGVGAGVIVLTWVLGRADLFEPLWAQALGLLVVSPPLVLAGYCFLHDDELEPYRGVSLHARAGACAVAYVALWGLYGYLAPRVLTGELWNWVFLAPPFMILGGLAALAALDLEFSNGLFLYAFYLLVTVLLRKVGGLGWIWESGGSAF